MNVQIIILFIYCFVRVCVCVCGRAGRAGGGGLSAALVLSLQYLPFWHLAVNKILTNIRPLFSPVPICIFPISAIRMVDQGSLA